MRTTSPRYNVSWSEGEAPVLLESHEVPEADCCESDEAVVAGLEVSPALLGAVEDGPARDGDEGWRLLMIMPVTAWQQARCGAFIISGNNNSNTRALIERKGLLAASIMIRKWVGELEKERMDRGTGGGSDGEVERKKYDDRESGKRKEENRSTGELHTVKDGV